MSPVRLLMALMALGLCLRAADRPNFVFLMSEDNSHHYLRLFDPQGAPTPAIEAMAAHGITFNRAFSNAPVCSVARSTLATSCYAPRLGIQYHRKIEPAQLPDGQWMFQHYLQDAGYYTVNNRKTDYNAAGEGTKIWNVNSASGSWRDKGRAADQPFFYKESFPICHESSLHFPASDMQSRKTTADPEKLQVPACYPDSPTFRYTMARYLDNMMAMDEQVASVISKLEADGLLEDTFVFYFGDHGGVLPGSKGYLWERGLHIPFVVRIPEHFKHLVDYAPGTRCNGFVSFIDFGPTVLQLAGAKIPDNFDGRPFLGPGVAAADVEARDTTIGYADRFDEKYDLVRTIRKGRFKYMRSYQPFNFDGLYNEYRYKQAAYQDWRRLNEEGKLTGPPAQFFQIRPAEALYDVETDPWETKNLAGDPAQAATLAALRSELTTTLKGWPDLSFFPESYLVGHGLDNPLAFGQREKAHIARLIDIADLSLLPFAKAADGIREALASQDPWERYWALIACSSHGAAAAEFADTARKLAAGDANPLVRTRAAEFLGLNGLGDPGPTIRAALKAATSEAEGLLILNTAVLLTDGPRHYDLQLDPKEITFTNGLCGQRLTYLTGMKGQETKKKKK